MTMFDGIEVRFYAADPRTGGTLIDSVTGDPIFDDDVEGVAREMARRNER